MFVLAVLGLFGFQAYAYDEASISGTGIEDIARKYRPTKRVLSPEVINEKFQETRARLTVLHKQTNDDSLAGFIMRNFYPDLRGISAMVTGEAIAPKTTQTVDMTSAIAQLERVWLFRNRISKGATEDAGRAVAQLMRRFAARRDMHQVSKETGSTPYSDLQGDISRLPQALAYRINWGFERLGEFGKPGRAWTPDMQFQLGEANQEFIRGFLEVQYDEETTNGQGQQAALDRPSLY